MVGIRPNMNNFLIMLLSLFILSASVQAAETVRIGYQK